MNTSTFNLKSNEQRKLTAALFFLNEASCLLNQIADDSYDRDSEMPDEIEQLSDDIYDRVSQFKNKYMEHVPYDRQLKVDMVAKLATDLPKMTEIDEVNMTLKLITNICTNNLTAAEKEHVEQLLSWIDQRESFEEFRKTYLTPEYQENIMK